MGFLDDFKEFIDPVGEAIRVAGEKLGVDPQLASLGSNVSTARTVEESISPDIPDSGNPMEDFLRRTTPEAQQLLGTGVRGAVDLTGQTTAQASQQFDPFADLGAFNEQLALLGLSGQEAQQQAIAGIPVNPAQQEAQRRQMQTLQRQAAAQGRLGGGSTLLGTQQLAGQQQAQSIFERINQLGGLSDVSRRARSSLSSILEAGGARESALLAGLGPQQASILLGAAAPIVQARTGQAELAGIRGISEAQQRGQIASQLAQLGGQFFNQPASDPFPTTAGGFGTVPGSQQTQLLLEQQAGF
jgi:hypothetical protein